MTTKEELIESAKKALTQEEIVIFEESLRKNDLYQIRIISEENLDKSKQLLYDNAILEHCDPVVVSHFKMSDEFFNKAFDYVISNIEVVE